MFAYTPTMHRIERFAPVTSPKAVEDVRSHIRHVLTRQAFVGKPQPERGILACVVPVVALPLDATVSQIVEHIREEEKRRFGIHDRFLRESRVPDIAEFCSPVLGADVHDRIHPDTPLMPFAENGEEERIAPLGKTGEPIEHFCFARERAVRHVVPDRFLFFSTVREFVKIITVAPGIDAASKHMFAF